VWYVDIIKREGNPKEQSGVDNSETHETLGTKHRTQTNKTQKQQQQNIQHRKLKR
jgi:hypothetical protein